MKKSDLKKAIKPLVKECIHEILLEEGMLSNIVAEVATGLHGNTIVESNKKSTQQLFTQEVTDNSAQLDKLKEQKRRMLDAIGNDAYNGVDLFEGTTPMGSPGSGVPKPGAVDLGDTTDSGVDISSLMGGASKIWKAMK
tara:strand:+ start:535 stop:951 length:417 start_codon:yes stop_codon:yes gene_type:complete